MKGFWLQDLPHHKYRQTISVFETNTHKLILPLPLQAAPSSISGTGGLKLKRLCQLLVPCPSQREIHGPFNTTLPFLQVQWTYLNQFVSKFKQLR